MSKGQPGRNGRNRKREGEHDRWVARSGKVVTYKKGEQKKSPPPPKPWQRDMQDKWMWR